MSKEYKPSELAEQMIDYLDCPCELFPPMVDDDPIMAALAAAQEQSREGGYTPVLIKVDEVLWEMLTANADEENGTDYQLENVRAYRRKMLSAELPSGAEILNNLLEERKEEAEEDELDWDNEIVGEFSDGEPVDRLTSYWNYSTEWTDEVILAKIPTDKPWQIFAWLPMGNWNECPDTLELMAVSKRWYEEHGAIPVAVSHDELEFVLDAPVTDPVLAGKIALEQYVFCPDRVDQCESEGQVGNLADSLTKSNVWYFWWD